MDSMVIKGLDPDTNYRFAVRAMNAYGFSPRSRPSNIVRTLGEFCVCPKDHEQPWLPLKASLAWGFLVPSRGIAWDRALLGFPPAVFPRPLKVRLTTGIQTISVPRQPGKVYFCVVLGEFVVGFRLQSQGSDITNEICDLSLSLIF